MNSEKLSWQKTDRMPVNLLLPEDYFYIKLSTLNQLYYQLFKLFFKIIETIN